MSALEVSYCMELIDLISVKVGEVGLKQFVRDFAEFCENVLDDTDDEDYIEVDESDESVYTTDSEENATIEVDELYTTETDNEGFLSLKECEVINQK